MAYSRALASALVLLSASSFGCSLARGVTGTSPGTDVGLADTGMRDAGDAGMRPDARDAFVPDIGIDAGMDVDANIDSGTEDVGIDAFTPDAFTPDTGIDAFTPDAFVPDTCTDAFVPDAFTPDTGTDAFVPDAFTPDTGTDAFVPDCSAGQTRCLSGSVLQSCTTGLLWGNDVTCSIACVNSPVPSHCAVFQPSNVMPGGAVAPAPLSIAAGTTVVVETTGCTGVAGLAVEAQLTAGRDACVLRVASLSVAATGVLYAYGSRPLVVVSTGDVTIDGIVDTSSFQTDPTLGLLVRGAGSGTGGTDGGDGSDSLTSFADGGGGGGGFCGAGGDGGDGGGSGGAPGVGGGATASTTLEPLVGGADGGSGGTNPDSGGPGGGAIQISSFTRITIGAAAVLQSAGGGGDQGINDANDTNAGGGGGSGGALLVEAPLVMVTAGARFSVGGGGGASGGCVGASDGRDGGDASESFFTGTLRAPGGAHQCGPSATGGSGAGDTASTGGTGVGGVTNASGGGGGAGFVYFRTTAGTTPTGVVTNPTMIVGAGVVHSL